MLMYTYINRTELEIVASVYITGTASEFVVEHIRSVRGLYATSVIFNIQTQMLVATAL